jgi:acyl-CoA reductase-like NAD-dependent aldehyde dehydrogenase
LAPEYTRQQVDAAFELAAKAARDWRADEPQRRAVLRRAGQVLLVSAADLVPVLTAEQGKAPGPRGVRGVDRGGMV